MLNINTAGWARGAQGTDSLWKHKMKSSTCHIGQEQLANPAMLPSSCGEEPKCSTQLLQGWPRFRAGDAVASVAKSVEGGLDSRGSQDRRRELGVYSLGPRRRRREVGEAEVEDGERVEKKKYRE